MSKKCTPLWREAHFQVKMCKTHQVRTTFGSCDVEKVHAVVARSTFPSQNVQNTRGSDHFWKSRCRKSACRCGAKHILKSKVLKTGGLGPLLEVEMSKKCTTFRYASLHYTTLQLQLQLHSVTLPDTNLHYTKLHYTHYMTLHYTTFHYIPLHYTTVHYTTLD